MCRIDCSFQSKPENGFENRKQNLKSLTVTDLILDIFEMMIESSLSLIINAEKSPHDGEEFYCLNAPRQKSVKIYCLKMN